VTNGGSTNNGNLNVNGSLTVTQPLGGGINAVYITDGGAPLVENSIGVLVDQSATTFVMKDAGISGNLTFEGTAGVAGLFGLSKPLRLGGVGGGPTDANLFGPQGQFSINIGSVAEPTALNIVCPGAGGTRAFNVTDEGVGAAANAIGFYLNQGDNTGIVYTDSGTDGKLSYDGTLNQFNAFNTTSGFANLNLGDASTIATSNIVPAAPGTVSVGSAAVPVALVVNASPAGGGTTSFLVTDNGVGVALNSLLVQLNQGDEVKMSFTDSGSTGILSFDGVEDRFNIDKFFRFGLTAQAGIAGPGGANSVTVADTKIIAGASVVLVTPIGTLGAAVTSPPHVTLNTGVGFTISWTGGNATGTFSYFIAKY
jgi:hypothetical protein